MNINAYELLNIKPYQLNKKNVKNAYLQMIRKYPPESNSEMFKKIRKAYDILINANSPYEKLSISPLPVTEMTKTKEELKEYLEKKLNILDKKIALKKSIIIESLKKELA
jgi:hypothetical protein